MSYISVEFRDQVRSRAKNNCEYCRLNELYSLNRFHIDHIYAEKHRGETILENLCLSCAICNGFKGTDLTSLDPLTNQITSLYHPRRDKWSAHFQLKPNGQIEGLTPTGRITVFLLHFNQPARVQNRLLLMSANLYLPAMNEPGLN